MWGTYDVCLTWRTTIKNRIPQAISTFSLPMTMTTPPSCPMRLITTKSVARNQPHPQEMSMYSLCSFHWVHIRTPSSKNVDTRQARATTGKICFPRRAIWKRKLGGYQTSCAFGPIVLQMHKRFEVNRTKIKGACQSDREAAPQESWSDLTIAGDSFEHFEIW